MTPVWDDELQQALDLACQAGALALSMQGGATEERKSDDSPVSAADRAADACILAGLSEAFPGDATLTEESPDDRQRRDRERVWIVDPIDGTRSFLDGGNDWAVHLALAIHGRLSLGVVVLPAHGRAWAGRPGQGLWRCDPAGRTVWIPPAGPAVLATSHRGPGPSPVMPYLPEGYSARFCHSVGCKADLLLRGEAGLYIRRKPIWEWDAAAPAAVLLAAGATACDVRGAPLLFNRPGRQGPGLLLSTRSADLPGIIAALAPTLGQMPSDD